jgi:glycosyltransferase involved in cell wall biosynthesis
MYDNAKKDHVAVSIIIPTYNRAKLLPEAIDSVLKQTFRDLELIVVDDGSTDETAQILQDYDSNIQVIRQHNQGVSAARNRGILHADGELIAFLDSDDLWKPRKLKVQVEYMRAHPEVMICQTEEIWMRRGARVNPGKKHKKYSGWFFENMLPLCIVSPSAVIMRRELFAHVGMFDESLPVCEDYDLWLRVGLYYPIMLIEEPLIIKRGGHENQLSQKYWGIDRFRVQSLQKLLDNERLTDKQRIAVMKELTKKCRILTNGCLKRGKKKNAQYFREVVEQYS